MKSIKKIRKGYDDYNVVLSYSELYDLREFCQFYMAIQPQLSQFTDMETEELLKTSKKMTKQIERIMNNEK